ncbi:RimK family alpha-L-glutamate ligase [Streptomyces sp. NPDC056632]|uniref:ATP-grasp domain-containing protein n=1 Tax=Streptomyces sp. NPDC056632 TaxID=3345884 RepID=UPI0036B51485
MDGIDAVFRSIEQIAVSVEHGGTRAFETVGGRDLADFGMIQIPSYPRPTATLLSAVSACLEARGRTGFADAGISAPTKLYQSVRLTLAGVPVPETHYLPRSVLRDRYRELADRLGVPFVLKALSASCGRFNYLVAGEGEFRSLVEEPCHAPLMFLAQRYIPNNGTFRLLVFGDDVPVVMHRCNTDGGHLTNTARGGHATLFEPDTFDEEVKSMAVHAASIMGNTVAGVNVVQHREERTWHVLEVTPSPALVTGAFVDEKLDAYAAYLRRASGTASAVVGSR